MKTYEINMKMTYSATVTVEAESPEEAREKADDGIFVDSGMAGAELSDWLRTGSPREV